MPRLGAFLRAILIAIAAAAILLPALVVLYPPSIPPARHTRVVRPHRVVPKTALPDVEPLALQAVDPDDARAFNASVPFVGGPNPAARAFRFRGDPEQLARATDCLAAAVYYEAGDDSTGERAVAQVVLNRLRHPAFPKTVCGVVFQGSERSTGCQFTFSCDGALARTPSEAAWRRAREVASGALSGKVYKPVGYATHYHTDWVVPYWQSSLDKIAEVHTHLFFRWTGWWGTPPAFNRTPQPGEPVIAALGRLSDSHRTGLALGEADAAIAASAPFLGRSPIPLASDPNSFLTSLDPARAAEWPDMAQRACGDRPKCKFMGWTDVDTMAFVMPLSTEQLTAMSFSYLRDRTTGFERMLWNCGEYPRPAAQCMRRALRLAPVTPLIVPDVAATGPRGPGMLDGVRRKPLPAPVLKLPQLTPDPAPSPKATAAGS